MSMQVVPIPGTGGVLHREESGLGNLITLALMYPEIMRKIREAREGRRAEETGLGWMAEAMRPPVPTVTPPALPGTPQAGPAVSPNPLAVPTTGPELGVGGLLTGLGTAGIAGDKLLPYGPAPDATGGGWPAEITARLAAARPAGGAGWLGLPGSAAPEVTSALGAVPLAANVPQARGLDNLFGSDQWRGFALQRAIKGDPRWLNLKPAGFTPTPEQQAQAYQWGDLGGKEQFTQGQLTERAQAGINARLQIAGDKLAADQARAGAATRSKDAAQHYRNAVSLRQRAQESWRQAAEGGEPGWAERGAEFDREADAEASRGDWLELNTPAGEPAAGPTAPVTPAPTTPTRPTVQAAPGGRIGTRLAVTRRGQDLTARAAGARLNLTREQLHLAREKFAFLKTRPAGGAGDVDAVAGALASVYPLDDNEAKGIAALKPSERIAALKYLGILGPDEAQNAQKTKESILNHSIDPRDLEGSLATAKQFLPQWMGLFGYSADDIKAASPKSQRNRRAAGGRKKSGGSKGKRGTDYADEAAWQGANR